MAIIDMTSTPIFLKMYKKFRFHAYLSSAAA